MPATVAAARAGPRFLRGFPPLLFAVVAAAWVALLAWGSSPHATYLDHSDSIGGLQGMSLFLTSWSLMVAAMMLPTAVALFDAFGLVVERAPDGRSLMALVAVGFALVWLLVGSAFRALDPALHALVDAVPAIDARPALVGAALLVAAGGYQFSTLKGRCLTRCRSPRGLVLRRWSGRSRRSDALGIGVAYGWSCAGCCWALMLLMFGLGAANPAWMLGLGGVMALEKNVASARWLSGVVGAALIAVGSGMAAGAIV